MDALILRTVLAAFSVVISTGATWQSRNFVVTAPTTEEAQTVAETAEEYRRQLSVYWLGGPLDNWSRPCHVTVKSGAYSAAGHTTFQFVGKEVVNWRMMLRGSQERILDSVLPHEVNHTIFACYYRRPLPRWADEGAATLFEDPSEQRIQLQLLQIVIAKPREFIPLRRLLSMKDYPRGHRPMLILYAEGFALVDFLVQQGGPKTYLTFLSDGQRHGWDSAIRRHYNHDGIEALERDWRGWVLAGMPRYGREPAELFAMAEPPQSRSDQMTRKSDQAAMKRSRNFAATSPDRITVSQQREYDRPQTGGRRVSQDGMQRPHASVSSPKAPHSDSGATHKDSTRGRRATLQAPAPRDRPATGTGQAATAREPETTATQTHYEANTRVPSRFNLQPTNHRNGMSPQRRTSDLGLPWKRTTLTGSIPQWAGFPGQSESF